MDSYTELSAPDFAKKLSLEKLERIVNDNLTYLNIIAECPRCLEQAIQSYNININHQEKGGLVVESNQQNGMIQIGTRQTTI